MSTHFKRCFGWRSDRTEPTSLEANVVDKAVKTSIHVKRCFGWRLDRTELTLHEANILDEAGIEDPILRSYLAWRRSQMLCSVPVLFFAAVSKISGTIQCRKKDFSFATYEEMWEEWECFRDSILTGPGKFLYSLPLIANLFLLMASVGAIGLPTKNFHVWSHWRLSSKILRYGFIVSFILPMLPALVPLTSVADYNQVKEIYFPDVQDFTTKSFVETFADIILLTQGRNFVSVLPTIMSFPSGLVAGSLRIEGLLPYSSLAAWILTTSAPFLSIIWFILAFLVIQYQTEVRANVYVLASGLVMRGIAPLLYVLRRDLYVKACSDETEKKVDSNQKTILRLNIGGILIIIGWMVYTEFADENEAGEYSWWLLQFWGRFIATSVVFTDIFLRMTVTNWREEKNAREDTDELYGSIEMGIRKQDQPKEDVVPDDDIPSVTGVAFPVHTA